MSVHIRNLTKQLLHLHRIGREIEPEASLEVSDEDAAKLAGHPLLDIPEPQPPVARKAVQPKEDGEQK